MRPARSGSAVEPAARRPAPPGAPPPSQAPTARARPAGRAAGRPRRGRPIVGWRTARPIRHPTSHRVRCSAPWSCSTAGSSCARRAITAPRSTPGSGRSGWPREPRLPGERQAPARAAREPARGPGRDRQLTGRAQASGVGPSRPRRASGRPPPASGVGPCPARVGRDPAAAAGGDRHRRRRSVRDRGVIVPVELERDCVCARRRRAVIEIGDRRRGALTEPAGGRCVEDLAGRVAGRVVHEHDHVPAAVADRVAAPGARAKTRSP